MKTVKIIVISFLVALVSLSLLFLFFPANAYIAEVRVANLSKTSNLLASELSKVGYTPNSDKSYYRMVCTINIKSNLPFSFRPVLKLSNSPAKIVGFALPYSSYANIDNFVLPFEKVQPVKISPFGKYRGKFMFLVESSKTNPDELAKNFSFTLLNLKYTKDLSSPYLNKLTAHRFPKIKVKFTQNTIVKEEKLVDLP